MQTRHAGFILVIFATFAVNSTARADESKERMWPACRAGDLAAVKQLLADGIDVNASTEYGATGLSYAADKGHVELVRFLLDKGANPNTQDTFYKSSPLTWATMNEHWEVIVLLVEHGAEGVEDVLAKVAAAGNTALVKRLIKTGKLDTSSLTRALITVGKEHREVIVLLQEAGAKASTAIDTGLLDEYVGKYELKPGFVLTVRREDDQLMVQATGQPEFQVYAESETTFFFTVVEAKVTFKRNEQGKVDQVVLNQGGRAMPGRRLSEQPKTPVDLTTVEKFAGRYETEDGDVFIVAIEDEQLVIGAEGNNLAPLTASGENTFHPVANPSLKITFTVEDGNVTGYIVDRGDTKLVRKRVDAPAVAAIVPTKRYQPTKPMNWPSFRGPHGSGVADGQRAPTKWNAETGENIKWKTVIPGLALSSPVVWGDRLFITTADSGDADAEFRAGAYGDIKAAKDDSPHEWKVLCLNAKSGKILWGKTAHRGKPRSERHTKATQANCTAAVDGQHVVVNFGSEGLYCYDFEGELLWKKDLGILNAGWFFDPSYQWGFGSSPVIHDDLVIVQCDVNRTAFIAAYQIDSGSEVWRTTRDELPSWGTPTTVKSAKRVQVVTNSSKHIYGYNPRTGEELWRLSGNSEVTVGTPVFGHDLMFFTGGYPPIQPIYAVNVDAAGDITLKEGEETNEHVAWSKRRGGTYMPTPIVYEDYLYTCGNNGVLTCYEAKTGKQVYRTRIADGVAGSYTASPIAADGKLYFSSEDSGIFVVQAGPKYELLAENPMGEIVMATPAISDGMIFVRTIRYVYGIGE